MSQILPLNSPHCNFLPLASGPAEQACSPGEDQATTPGTSTRSAKTIRSVRDQRDTADGCRERAAADLLRSVSMLIANERRRMESSAASWTARAELLERLEAGMESRRHTDANLPTDPAEPPVRS